MVAIGTYVSVYQPFCLSFHLFLSQKTTTIPAVEVTSQNVTDKVVKYLPSGSLSDPYNSYCEEEQRQVHYINRQGKVNLCKLKLTSVYHHLSRIGP